MMRIINSEGLHYPASAFRSFHPNVAFAGDTPPVAALEAHGWKVLREDPKPETPGKIAERGPVEWRDGEPYWTWVERDMTEAEAEQARAETHALLVAWADDFLGQFTRSYPKAETLSWTKKEAAAEAYEDGNATQRQIAALQNEADARGIPVADLVASILAKAEPFNQIIEFASGLRSRTQAQIDAAQPEELQGVLDAAKAEALAKAQELGVT